MNRRSYVYELVDPRNGEPFYVGKGVGDRAQAHMRPTSAGNKAKRARIEAIRSAGHEPKIEVLAADLTNDEAVALERDRIAEVGIGNLTNQSLSSGPAPDPNALTAQLRDGRGSHVHAVVPAELHYQLKLRSIMTGSTLSQIVAESLSAYFEANP